MQTLTAEKLREKLDRQKYRRIFIYEGNYSDISERPMFDEIGTSHGTQPEEVRAMLDEFIKIYAGRYTFVCCKRVSDTPDKGHLMYVDLRADDVKESEPALAQPMNAAPQISVEEIEQRIYARLSAAAEKRLQEQRIEELQAENERIKTGAGKLSLVLEKLLVQFLPAGDPAQMTAQPLQGAPEKITELENALGVLVDELGETTIINLANKFKAGDGAQYLPLIKSFANG
jgi:hypothetical protein